MRKKVVELDCKVCGRNFEIARALSCHITHGHKINLKDYYDKYFKKETCKICKEEVKFLGLMGYRSYCSKLCQSLSETVLDLSKYDLSNVSKMKDSKDVYDAFIKKR